MMQPTRKVMSIMIGSAAPADIVELVHQRGEAEPARLRGDAHQRDGERAQQVDEGAEELPTETTLWPMEASA